MITFEVETELSACERLWKLFSPNEYLFDDWEYRVCFYDPAYYSLYFIVGKDNDALVGILPLWKARDKSYYEWFGGEFPERNRFMVRDNDLIQKILEQLPDDIWLPYMVRGEQKYLPIFTEETRFFLDLENYAFTLDGYLATFSAKHRKNLKRDLKTLKSLNYSVVRNSIQDFQRMIELNARRFEKKSFFAEHDFIHGFQRLMEEALRRDELEMISIHINGVPEAVEVAIHHKETYAVLLGGNNLEISNIGKLLTVEHIKNALEKKARIVDFLVDDCGWKRMWNMSEEPMYVYEHEPPSLPHTP